jgi:hypothetical protein
VDRCRTIADHSDDVEAALIAYEEALFPRTEPIHAEEHAIPDLCLSSTAAPRARTRHRISPGRAS